ncbi:MAG: MFS transporter, partial [Anaerolineae bacterium]|nr:MFS transporter [Anaerolineae bacterium]
GKGLRNENLMGHGLLHAYGGVILRKAGVVGALGLVVVYLGERLGVAASMSGVLNALNPASQALLMPLWGRGADSVGRRPVFLVGHALTVLVPLMILLADSIWLVAAAFLVLGIGFAAFITGMTTYIGDLAPGDQQGELMGLLKVSQGLGGVLGPLVAGVVSSPSLIGYDGMFLTMSVVILIGLGLSFVGTKESRSAV